MIDPNSLQLLIIAGAISVPITSRILLKHRERALELLALRERQEHRTASPDIAELRREIEQLRDTTTQYDLSVERALGEIRHRLDAVEGRRGDNARSYLTAGAQEPPEQVIQIGGSSKQPPDR